MISYEVIKKYTGNNYEVGSFRDLFMTFIVLPICNLPYKWKLTKKRWIESPYEEDTSEKIGIIVLREKGMHLIDKVLTRIKTVESLCVKGLLGLEWKKENCRSNIEKLYPHITDEKILDDLEEIHGTKMIIIVLLDIHPDSLNMNCPRCNYKFTGDRLDNMHINRIKDDFRSLHGNVIHSSDTEELAEEEMLQLGVASADIIKMKSKTSEILTT